MTFKFFLTLIFILGLFAACGQREEKKATTPSSVNLSQASCEGFVQNDQGQQIYLGSRLTILASSDIPKEFLPAINDAIKLWNSVLSQPMFIVGSQENIDGHEHPGVVTIRWMTSWPADQLNEQGDTSLFIEGKQISGADIKINAQNFLFSTGIERDHINFESLILHELGHVLGLKHDQATSSVMYPQLPDRTTRLIFSDSDLAHVKCKY